MSHETILIVDDHPLVIEAVRHAISGVGEFNIIAASSAREMKNLIESGKDVNREIRLIFLDIRLPDANGIDLIPSLIADYGVPVIVMSGGDDEEFALSACISNGAVGFVQKSSNLTMFSSALRIVLEGGLFFPADYISGKKVASGQNVIASLSDRQLQILDLILVGKSNKQIGDTLYLAEGTVKNKVSELLAIFDVTSRSHIIVEANRRGYKPKAGPRR